MEERSDQIMPQAGLREKKKGTGRGTGIVLALCAVAVLILLALLFLRGKFPLQRPSPPEPTPTAEATSTPSPDTEPPVIKGPHDMSVAVGMTLSYRSGVTAVDEEDGPVKLEVDASAVDLNKPGEYPVIYRARDKSGNESEITVTLTVAAVAGVNDDDPTADVSGEDPAQAELPPIKEVTAEMVDEEADRILKKILAPSMSQWEQARAIYNYVHTHVKYVGSSDKSSWLMGAYVGFTRSRGDCYNYFACSKALLTKAGIPNVDLYRVGGSTDHYWQLVNVGNGWYHFDACPHPDSYPLNSFLLDETAVREYTEKCSPVRTNYYVYDYENCPVTAVGFPVEELPEESLSPGSETEIPAVTETPDPEEALLPPGVLTTQPPAELPGETPLPQESQPAPEEPTEPAAPEISPEPEISEVPASETASAGPAPEPQPPESEPPAALPSEQTGKDDMT